MGFFLGRKGQSEEPEGGRLTRERELKKKRREEPRETFSTAGGSCFLRQKCS